jgi:hypothetical protein
LSAQNQHLQLLLLVGLYLNHLREESDLCSSNTVLAFSHIFISQRLIENGIGPATAGYTIFSANLKTQNNYF